MIKNKTLRNLMIFVIPLVIASVIKFFVSPTRVTPFNADEAIVALMARHITQGNLPVFFYGQSYMGSLDAIFISLGFRLFGEHVWVIRMIQSVLYLGTVFTGMILASRLLATKRGIFYTGLLMAIPTINVTLYSTVSLGGYGEMLLVGNLLLLGGLSIKDQIDSDQNGKGSEIYWGLFFWSLGAGFSFWIIGLALVYILPVLLIFFWKIIHQSRGIAIKAAVIVIVGGVIGSAPWWFTAITSNDLGIFSELAGSAIRSSGQIPQLLKPISRLVNLFVFGGSSIIGLRPPWDIQWLMLPLIPYAMIFWMVVLVHSTKTVFDKKRKSGFVVLALTGVVLAAGFIFSPYGDDPSGRYFLPLLTPMAIFAAYLLESDLVEKKFIEYGALALILIFNLGGIVQSAVTNPPGITTQFDQIAQIDHRDMDELIIFLRDHEIHAGYSNYWVAYPLAFLSGEELIFIPRLPYHEDFRYTARDDRYAPYQEVVKDSNQPAYITTKHEMLNQYLREKFQEKNLTWDEEKIGDFEIFYNLSSPVHVKDIGLGETTSP